MWRFNEFLGQQILYLGQHGSDSGSGGVHRMAKYGSRAEGSLEFLEGFMGNGVPGQGFVFSSVHRRQ